MNSWSGVYAKHLVEWENGPDGGAVLLLPRFRNGLLAKWIQPRLKCKYARIKLDEIGSFVWNKIVVGSVFDDVAAAMKGHFGEKAEPVEDRLAKFLTILKKGGFVELYTETGTH